MLRVVVVQGPPASGKTTLVRKLAADTGLGFLSKDSIKELFYDTLGTPVTRDESKAYGRASIQGMVHMLENLAGFDRTVFYEAALHPEVASEEMGRLVREYGIRVMQIYCYASAEELLYRFEARMTDTTRHPSHPEFSNQATLRDAQNWLLTYTKLQIANTVTIDTGEFDARQYENLRKSVNKFTQED